eukprot:1157840-Pelagomonas_calceolata.AAC.4
MRRAQGFTRVYNGGLQPETLADGRCVGHTFENWITPHSQKGKEWKGKGYIAVPAYVGREGKG